VVAKLPDYGRSVTFSVGMHTGLQGCRNALPEFVLPGTCESNNVRTKENNRTRCIS
jgi:hypothetical protein